MRSKEILNKGLRVAGAAVAVMMLGMGKDQGAARAVELAARGQKEECRFVMAVVRDGEIPSYHRHECLRECILYDADGKPIAAYPEPAPGECR